jgi:uncharacterized membrane protein YfcA
MEPWQYILLAAVGIVGGVLNVLAGGGSLLMMPALVLLGIDGSVANGTSRVAVVAQNLAAITGFRRKGFSDFRLSLTLAACAIPGGVAGALAGVRLEGAWFNRTLAVIMIGVMVLMAAEKKSKGKAGAAATDAPSDAGPAAGRRTAAHLLMIAVGFYGGFIQAGVGFLLMPVLHRVLGLDLVRTNMHKVFIVAGYMIPALIVYALNGKVFWALGLVLAVGTSIGGWVGSHLAVRKGDPFIRLVLNITLTALVVKLLWI